jgi:tetratricopeptide (TPR) repeat protein
LALNVQLSVEEVRVLLESGYLLMERREFAKAKEVFEGVEALGRGEAGGLGLGEVHLRLGNEKEAEKSFRAAAKANPKGALARAKLGELLHTMGKKDEALAELKEAEKLDASGPFGQYAASVRKAVEEGTQYKYKAPEQKKAKK